MKIKVITGLRGIAALAVCLFHFVVTTTDYVTNALALDVFAYGKYGVQLFFIISGIVIPLSMVQTNYGIRSIGGYLLRRFVRIEPPYLVAVVLGVIYLYVRNYVPSSTGVDMTPTWRDLFLHIGYLVPFVADAKWINPVFWTLAVEFQYYLFLALLFPLALSTRPWARWTFLAVLLAGPFLTVHGNFFPYWSAYFGMGIYYALYLSKRCSLVEYVVSSLLCAAVVAWKLGPIDLAIAFATLAVVHLWPDLESAIGRFLGRISYSLYLLHSIVGAAFVNYMSHRVDSPVGVFLVIVTGTLVSIGSAYGLWKFVERPSQLLSRTVGPEKAAEPVPIGS